MDNDEALMLLEEELKRLREASYLELGRLVASGVFTCERTGASGRAYQIEIQAVWDDRPGANVMVIGSVDDGGWRATVPLTRDFIMAPDGSLVGVRS
jgi:hypothetical protein